MLCVCVRGQMETGQRLGIRTTALLVSMDSVLGQAVGNTLEIVEAIDCLQGRGPKHVVDVVCTIGTTPPAFIDVTVAEWLARPTAVWKDLGSNLTADGCVYRNSSCDIQPWARAARTFTAVPRSTQLCIPLGSLS